MHFLIFFCIFCQKSLFTSWLLSSARLKSCSTNFGIFLAGPQMRPDGPRWPRLHENSLKNEVFSKMAKNLEKIMFFAVFCKQCPKNIEKIMFFTVFCKKCAKNIESIMFFAVVYKKYAKSIDKTSCSSRPGE